MKAAALVPLFAGLAALAPGARGEGPRDLEAEQVALYERIAPGVAVLTAGRAVGAGFAVAPGLLLTAAHVVDGAGAVDVLLRDGRRFRGEVVERAAGGLDLALVRIPAAPPVLELAPSARLRPGTVVATVGHPDGNRFTFGTGLVAQSAADGPDPTLVRLQLPLRQGASGAPVVDLRGRVVGVVALGASGTVTFAVRTEAALAALRGLAGVRVDAAAGPVARLAAPDAAPFAEAVPLAAHDGTSSPSAQRGERAREGGADAAADSAAPVPPTAPELVTAPAPRPREHAAARRRSPVRPLERARPPVAAPVLVGEPDLARAEPGSARSRPAVPAPRVAWGGIGAGALLLAAALLGSAALAGRLWGSGRSGTRRSRGRAATSRSSAPFRPTP